MSDNSNVSAIILAGGRSSRMGTPKALLPFDGEPLIVHLVRRVKALFEDVVIVGAPGQQLPPVPARVTHDEVAYQGPVGGIYYGLSAARGEFGFVTSCDSAFLSLPFVHHLLSLRDDYDVVVPRWADRYQPLAALYRKSVLPHLAAQLANGELRPVFLFDKVRTRILDEAEVRRFDPAGASFFNMNTPADYADAQARWRDAAAAGATITCTVELLGVARMVARTAEVPLVLPCPATLERAFEALAARVPALRGRVIGDDGRTLTAGYACCVNARDFVRAASAPVAEGDRIVILSADVGG